MTADSNLTPEIKALVGAESEPATAWDTLSRSELRRFTQAIMDADPIYWDDRYAASTKYGGVVCPPLFPLTFFRAPSDESDPLTEGFKENSDSDGAVEGMLGTRGLPHIPLSLKRRLNAGNEIEVFQLAKPGDRLTAKSRIADIYEKEGRSGRMVFIVTETTIWNDKVELLLVSRQTIIRR